MLLRCRKDEDRMCRRLLESLQKCIERRLRKHMDLVDDVHAVASHLRRHTHLVHQCLDVVDTVVGRGVELMDTVRPAFRERKA